MMKKPIPIKNALYTSMFWIVMALIFSIGIYFYEGREQSLDFLTAYLIEKCLSIDNLFLFMLIFKSFRTPPEYQYKVLFWGVFGAIAMRGVVIFFGLTLLNAFHGMFVVFGAFLIYGAIKMFLNKHLTNQPEMHPVLHYLKKWIPITKGYVEDHFFVKDGKKIYATPLFVVLLTIEFTDLIFALDSIPAVMAVTRDPLIVYSSNIFAILGLRSLHFALAGLVDHFCFLHYGLGVVLAFVGFKMLLSPWVTIPSAITLGVIIIVLGIAIERSIHNKRKTIKQ